MLLFIFIFSCQSWQGKVVIDMSLYHYITMLYIFFCLRTNFKHIPICYVKSSQFLVLFKKKIMCVKLACIMIPLLRTRTKFGRTMFNIIIMCDFISSILTRCLYGMRAFVRSFRPQHTSYY